ncbi:MAG: glucose-1-phosphate thymidylyltransferase RfbA [Planctomycetota bacterium]
MRKGILLAGGSGSRLHPLTVATSKQLLPVYDKPMVYYPLSCLMLADIRDVLIITTPRDASQFERLLGDGRGWGMTFQYATQSEPRGLADAFRIGEDFLAGNTVTLVLGDNVFYGQGFQKSLQTASAKPSGATIFGCRVSDPERYGVVELDDQGRAVSLEEKPARPKSRYAVPGLYFYDNRAVEYAKQIRPSKRGELEITDINRLYLAEGELSVELFSRGFAWLDAGTHESLAEASNLVMAVEKRLGQKIACPEEIAWARGWIDAAQLRTLAASARNEYGDYLRRLTDGGDWQ